MRVRPTYTEEFKADAVAHLRRSDQSIRQVAEGLGISDESLRTWYKREEMAKKKGKGKSSSKGVAGAAREGESAEERAARLERENASLRKEVDSLRMDREILKKAAAFFAKENE
jgi:transposase-like protein